VTKARIVRAASCHFRVAQPSRLRLFAASRRDGISLPGTGTVPELAAGTAALQVRAKPKSRPFILIPAVIAMSDVGHEQEILARFQELFAPYAEILKEFRR